MQRPVCQAEPNPGATGRRAAGRSWGPEAGPGVPGALESAPEGAGGCGQAERGHGVTGSQGEAALSVNSPKRLRPGPVVCFVLVIGQRGTGGREERRKERDQGEAVIAEDSSPLATLWPPAAGTALSSSRSLEPQDVGPAGCPACLLRVALQGPGALQRGGQTLPGLPCPAPLSEPRGRVCQPGAAGTAAGQAEGSALTEEQKPRALGTHSRE